MLQMIIGDFTMLIVKMCHINLYIYIYEEFKYYIISQDNINMYFRYNSYTVLRKKLSNFLIVYIFYLSVIILYFLYSVAFLKNINNRVQIYNFLLMVP